MQVEEKKICYRKQKPSVTKKHQIMHHEYLLEPPSPAPGAEAVIVKVGTGAADTYT